MQPLLSNELSYSTSIPLFQHLYQIYPSIPKYAADPSQSQIIETYDHIMGRYQGNYGSQPQFFIRSPAYLTILGDKHPYVGGFNQIGLCSTQEIIIAVGKGKGQRINFNNYQKAIYGQQSLGVHPINWKFERQSKQHEEENNLDHTQSIQPFKGQQQYENIIISTLKNVLGNDKSYHPTPFNVLIYCDFLPQQHLQWRTSLICALSVAFQVIVHGKKSLSNINPERLNSIVKRVQNLFGDWRTSCQGMYGKHSQMLLRKSLQDKSDKEISTTQRKDNDPLLTNIKFPEGLAIVIANSMTPLPKKLVQGKRDNLRHCQILIAIQIIKVELGTKAPILSIKQLMESMSCSLAELLESIQQILPHQAVSIEQIQQLTQKTLIQILKEVPYANNVIDQNFYFQPYKRIKFFVLQEMLIRNLCLKLTTLQQQTNKNPKMTALQIWIEAISQSSKNGRQLLNEPSQQIFEMITKVQGLFYSHKILGNGWGGNVIFLCSPNNADKIIEVLNKEFYLNQQNKILLGDELQMYTGCIKQPGNGLCVLDPESEIWY